MRRFFLEVVMPAAVWWAVWAILSKLTGWEI